MNLNHKYIFFLFILENRICIVDARKFLECIGFEKKINESVFYESSFFSMLIYYCNITKLELNDIDRTKLSEACSNLSNACVCNSKEYNTLSKIVTNLKKKGGTVLSPVKGMHRDVSVVDFRSMYPSLMISHNIFPDTLSCFDEHGGDGDNFINTNEDNIFTWDTCAAYFKKTKRVI